MPVYFNRCVGRQILLFSQQNVNRNELRTEAVFISHPLSDYTLILISTNWLSLSSIDFDKKKCIETFKINKSDATLLTLKRDHFKTTEIFRSERPTKLILISVIVKLKLYPFFAHCASLDHLKSTLQQHFLRWSLYFWHMLQSFQLWHTQLNQLVCFNIFFSFIEIIWNIQCDI